MRINMDITVTLTLEEVNAVIATMAQLPFNQVHQLVEKIRGQAIVQVQAASAAQQQEPEVLTPEQA